MQIMSKPPVEANIIEINDGPYFRAKLHEVPRVGELIVFYSFLDEATGHPPKKHYEVVQVVHLIYEASEKTPSHMRDINSINIYVKPSSGKFFS
jgi:hypothetical protein